MTIVINEAGYFSHFSNESGRAFRSLADLSEEYKCFLAWEWQNTSAELVGSNKRIITRKGADYLGEAEWHNSKTIDG